MNQPDAMRARAARGALWTSVGYALGQTIRFFGSLILYRLLMPEALATMLLVNTFISGLHLFSDVGIGPSMIQSPRGEDPVFANTAYTLQAVRGFLLWVVTLLAAVPFALFYDEPSYAWILPAVGLTAFIEGFSSTKELTANRNLVMGRITLVELVSQVAGLVVMVAWALRWPSAWALVAGALVSASARTLLNNFALPGPSNRFHWDRESARQLMHFGRWIFISTVLTFLAGQADRLIYGKLVDEVTVGVFYVALNLANFPSLAINNLLEKIAFPVFSRISNTGGELQEIFRRVRWKSCLLSGWGTAGLLGGGPTMIRLFYDDRYLGAGWMVQILAVAGWWSVLENANGAALLARGLARWTAAGCAAKLLAMLGFMTTGYWLGGFPGILMGASLSECFRYAVSTYAIRKEGFHVFDQDVKLTLLVGISSCAGWLAAQLIRSQGGWVAIEAAAVFVATSIFWLPSGLPHLRR